MNSQGRREVEGQWCKAGMVSAMLALLLCQVGLSSLFLVHLLFYICAGI